MSTPCPSRKQLEQFLDTCLDVTLSSAIASHINGCIACQAELERLTRSADGSSASVARGTGASEHPSQALKPLSPTPTRSSASDAAPRSWPSLADFDILGETGRGGMGTVYKARQLSLNRLVALKMVSAGGGQPAVARFRREAEAVARLQHVNIVQIFAIGEYEGQPYLALEWVEGGTLAQRLNGAPQPPLAAAAFVETLARATHIAHEQGIVHRDLKPSNILLKPVSSGPTADAKQAPKSGTATPSPLSKYFGITPPTDTPTSSKSGSVASNVAADYGVPKITDFGLAKLLDSDLDLTRTGDLMGTPCYMAPEQAKFTSSSSGEKGQVGCAADTYALGAILYEMLTGRPPFKGETTLETVLQVLHQDPVSPSRLQPRLPEDLSTICLKCLEKQPSKRYESALALAEDLRRFRQGEPILARRPGPMGLAWRWCRRRPAIAMMTAALALSLLAGFIGMGVLWLRAETNRRSAELNAENAELNLYFSRIVQAQFEWRLNNPAGVAALLNQCTPQPGEPDRRGWEWRYLRNLLNSDVGTLALDDRRNMYLASVRFSRDGRRLYAAGGNYFSRSNATGRVRAWDLPPEKEPILAHDRFVESEFISAMDVSHDDRLIAMGGENGAIRVWRPAVDEKPRALTAHSARIASLSLSPDGKRLAAADDRGAVTVQNTETGAILLRLQGDAVQFAAGGTQLITGGVPDPSVGRSLAVWDAADGRRLRTLPHDASAFVVSPDEKALILRHGSEVWVIDWDSGQVVTKLTGHEGRIYDVAISPDGLYIATAGIDRTVRVWDRKTGLEILAFRGHLDRVTCVAFHPTGRYLVSGDQTGGQVKIWDLTRHPEYMSIGGISRIGPGGDAPYHRYASVNAIGFTADSRRLFVSLSDRTLADWDARGVPDVGWTSHLPVNTDWLVPSTVAEFATDGRRIAFVDRADQKRVVIRDLKGERPAIALTGHSMPVFHVGWSRDGRRLVTAALNWRQDGRREIKVWDATTGGVVAEFRPNPILAEDYRFIYGIAALSADGKWIAFDDFPRDKQEARIAPGAGAQIRVCDATTGRSRYLLSGPDRLLTALTFSNDGSLLAAANDESDIRLYDLNSGRQVHDRSLQVPTMAMGRLAFSPDDRLLAAADREQVQIWQPRTGNPILNLRGAPPRGGDNGFNPIAVWSPDGGFLAVVNHDSSISVWDGSAGTSAVTRRAEAERRAFGWHLSQAEQTIRVTEFRYAAEFHLRAVESLEPANADLRVRRGKLRGALGLWRAAADDFEIARRKRPVPLPELTFDHALLEYRAGNAPAWRRVCNEMREQLDPGDNVSVSQMARAIQVAPGGETDPQFLQRWSAEAASGGPLTPEALSLLAGAKYRQGQHGEALGYLERAARVETNGLRLARVWAFLTMTHAQLRQLEQARSSYARLEQWFTSITPPKGRKPLTELPAFLGLGEWLEMRILGEEARAALRGIDSPPRAPDSQGS